MRQIAFGEMASEHARGSGTDDRRFVSLFSGAGGLDLGLEAAGWSPLAQIEMDRDAAGTLRLAGERRCDRGQLPVRVLQERIENVSPLELRASLKLRRGSLPLLAGGPPCQPFTTHGLRQSIADNRASGVWPTYLNYVDALRPKALLIENVDGLLSAAIQHRPLVKRGKGQELLQWDEKKGSFLFWLVTALVERGYTISWGVVEAADYGVPQFRQRSIIIGVRGASPCFLPPAEYGYAGGPAFRTLKDALGQVTKLGAVQPLSERKQRVYERIPPGGNWRQLPVALQRQTMGAAHLATGGKSGWWRRLTWDAPSPTILGMPDHSSTALVHPDEVRCLSVYECAAVQSFPPDVEFAGSSLAQYQQIGNAVPPMLAESLGRHLSHFLSTGRDLEPDPPDWRRTSANRRIGIHGWMTPKRAGFADLRLNAKVREDHIWSDIRGPRVRLDDYSQ